MNRPGGVFPLRGPVVVRSPNWLGDAVMALPAVRNLKTRLLAEPLAVACPEKLAPFWRACPFVDRVVPLRQPRALLASARTLRAESFGTAILLPNSWRSVAEAAQAGIGQRIGYARGGRRWLLSRAIPAPERQLARLHQHLEYLDLMAALGAPSDPGFPLLQLAAGGEKTAAAPYVALCPGAEYGPAKRWPVENFAAVARELGATRGLRAVIFGAPGDRAVAAALAELLPGAENRAGTTSLEEFMRGLAGAQQVICNDSGAMHLAAALGVPGVAVFGSTEPALTGPLGGTMAVVRHHVPCSPCFLRTCPLDFACMKQVTAAMVLAKVAARP